jgi:hypothetical protein
MGAIEYFLSARKDGVEFFRASLSLGRQSLQVSSRKPIHNLSSPSRIFMSKCQANRCRGVVHSATTEQGEEKISRWMKKSPRHGIIRESCGLV